MKRKHKLKSLKKQKLGYPSRRTHYQIVWKAPKEKHWRGSCDDPCSRSPKIHIDPNLPDRDLLNTIIHECIHAELYMLDEEAVGLIGDDLSRILYSAGFRLPKR